MNVGAAVERLTASGVRLDGYLMVRPDLTDTEYVRGKIAADFRAVRRRIDALRQSHGTVLYMPGSYDLVHAGHAWHIHSAEGSLGPAPVVALADDDDLIRAAKGSDRPVQSADAFTLRGVPNWRLSELASLPKVTVAGFLPSPLSAQELATPDILAAQCGWEELVRLLARPSAELADMGMDPALYRVVGEYASLLMLMQVDPGLVADAFRRRTYPWSIQSWQLYLHCYLGAGTTGPPMVRIMSHRDDAHAAQIAYLMHAAGIRTRYLHELEIVTTTELISRYPGEELIAQKLAAYA